MVQMSSHKQQILTTSIKQPDFGLMTPTFDSRIEETAKPWTRVIQDDTLFFRVEPNIYFAFHLFFLTHHCQLKMFVLILDDQYG
jgi:hypothetical protein